MARFSLARLANGSGNPLVPCQSIQVPSGADATLRTVMASVHIRLSRRGAAKAPVGVFPWSRARSAVVPYPSALSVAERVENRRQHFAVPFHVY